MNYKRLTKELIEELRRIKAEADMMRGLWIAHRPAAFFIEQPARITYTDGDGGEPFWIGPGDGANFEGHWPEGHIPPFPFDDEGTARMVEWSI